MGDAVIQVKILNHVSIDTVSDPTRIKRATQVNIQHLRPQNRVV